jgi:poly(3-hydroxybutyrate) depolymerase
MMATSGGGMGGGNTFGGAGGDTTAMGGTAAGGMGGTMGGPAAPVPSTGCGTAAGQALGSWEEQSALNVDDTNRQWWVWLPNGYDPEQAYPLIFTFHGCGGPDNIIPIQNAAGDDAIVVRGTGISDGCWTYGGTGQDVQFFDAMLAELEANHCVDTSRVFSMGYSSGAWLTNTLACARGDKLRAAGTVSGGVVGNRGDCVGDLARIFIHDADDTTNRFVENGNEAELERLVELNGCDTEADPVSESPEPCARYQNCDDENPVVMCLTAEQEHGRQDALAIEAFWGFFSSF